MAAGEEEGNEKGTYSGMRINFPGIPGSQVFKMTDSFSLFQIEAQLSPILEGSTLTCLLKHWKNLDPESLR
jgi:hypothetical protein